MDMRAYLLIFKTQALMTLQYRSQALAGIFTQFAFGFMRIFVMIAFYKGSVTDQPLSLTQIVTYVWMTQALLTLMAWRPDPETYAMIKEGSIAYEMVRPIRISYAWLMRSLARRGLMPLMRGIPLVFITSLLPAPYKFVIVYNFQSIFLGIITIILAWLLGGVLNNTLNILTIYLMSAEGIGTLFPIIMMFFSGLILPIPLFPSVLQKIFFYTPFVGIMDTPSRVITGNYNLSETLSAIAVQIFWVLILTLLNDYILERKLQNVSIQGG